LTRLGCCVRPDCRACPNHQARLDHPTHPDCCACPYRRVAQIISPNHLSLGPIPLEGGL